MTLRYSLWHYLFYRLPIVYAFASRLIFDSRLMSDLNLVPDLRDSVDP
jgi:hypothetical protein